MRSIGIDPGDHALKVVELDGSYKKTRLVAVHVLPADTSIADAAMRADAAAAAVRVAFDEGMKGEVTLGHPCREAVLRTIELPFKGHDAIRKVVKAEIESEIQSQSVDDMVVDFHEVGEGVGGGTRILVASVPKPGLRVQLAALAAHKIEPERIDLDTMALWRVAHWVGAFAEDGDAVDDQALTAVLDVGARSVKIVLVEGEKLVEMRALRLGDAAIADDVARRHGLGSQAARKAVIDALASGADQQLEVKVDLPAATNGGDDAPAEPAAARAVVVSHDEVEGAHTAWLQRLSRELTRFLAASGRAGKLRAVYCTGDGMRMPGTREMLAAVFGMEPQTLDVLARLQHDLSPEQAAEMQSSLATAVGLALSPLGGPEGFELRQEDLVVTRGFERIKFPLAIACMVGLLTLFVIGNTKSVELRNLELTIGQTFVNKQTPNEPVQFFGMLNAVFSAQWFSDTTQFRLEATKGRDYTYKDLIEDLVKEPVYKRIAVVRDRLRAVADQKQKESGIYEDVSLESGLAVLVRWAELLTAVEPEIKGFLVTKVGLNMGSRQRQRRLEFTAAFRGADFRTKASALRRAIETELKKPDSPFESFEDKLDPFKNDSGVEGGYYAITMDVKQVFQPFGPSGNAALGAAERRAPATNDALAKEDR